ncbi:hypothetical protein ElyMa_001870600 [Elysia marginata]|uniref:Uncharacterized protein n=1 Tax=Elysia marginata TaxID=1093978 RepID=A0AAV4EPD8_9GAST|nr:hypothetical protein ElyMa_001870600 [Elysia marginata]
MKGAVFQLLFIAFLFAVAYANSCTSSGCTDDKPFILDENNARVCCDGSGGYPFYQQTASGLSCMCM